MVGVFDEMTSENLTGYRSEFTSSTVDSVKERRCRWKALRKTGKNWLIIVCESSVDVVDGESVNVFSGVNVDIDAGIYICGNGGEILFCAGVGSCSVGVNLKRIFVRDIGG